jgi:hypothetical protein
VTGTTASPCTTLTQNPPATESLFQFLPHTMLPLMASVSGNALPRSFFPASSMLTPQPLQLIQMLLPQVRFSWPDSSPSVIHYKSPNVPSPTTPHAIVSCRPRYQISNWVQYQRNGREIISALLPHSSSIRPNTWQTWKCLKYY